MNNVWTTIALRAPCATRHARRRPLLELFNGYARYQSTTCLTARRNGWGSRDLSSEAADNVLHSHLHAKATWSTTAKFSTSALLSARSRTVTRTRASANASDSKLETPPSVASHTEGIPEQSEELSWRDYDPKGGMPLPGGDRPQTQINGIFRSEELDVETGNYILNVVYWRRMSGALIDVGLSFPRSSEVTQDQAARALRYVRSLDPDFDEQAAGQVWAEEESLRLQEVLQERAVKLRLYKPSEPVEEDIVEAEPEEEQGTKEGRERYRDSQLQQIRAENEAKYEDEEARKADAEAKAELAALHTHRGPLELAGGVQPSVELVTYTGKDGVTISRPQTQAWLQPVERQPWVKYYEEQAQIIKDNTIPQLSLLQRLGPSFLVLLLVFGAGLYVSENYTPPPRSARIFPDTPPAVATLAVLSGTMAAFFLLSRFPPFWRTLSKYFTLVPVYPSAVSVVGCAFRHQPASHLLVNTISLWLFGLMLHEDVGRAAFLSIFFASGALGSFTSLTYHVLRKNWATYIFGSSGCVLGVVAAASTLRPNSTITVFGQDVPVAVWLWLALWGVAELVAMKRFKGLGIDHAGHLGGLAGGFGAGLWLRQRARRRREDAMKKEPLMVEVN